jgi:hypothetical protein
LISPVGGVSPTQPDTDTIHAYYRFETGPAGGVADKILDSSQNHLNGTVLAGAPTYDSSVAFPFLPKTEHPDHFSLQMGNGDALQFPYAFPFENTPNATLEFWVYPSSSGASDIIWGTLSPGDTNRFEVGLEASFGPLFVNYRDASGVLHRLGRTKVTIPNGEWSFVAIVKSGSRYLIYVNNSQTGHLTKVESRADDRAPALPNSTGWSINGRGIVQPSSCCQFVGLIDEIRLSDQALRPNNFLVSPTGTPDIAYVQTALTRTINQYQGVSLASGAVYAAEVLPTGDTSNGDVVYDPLSDTLWYPEANYTSNNVIEVWQHVSRANGNQPTTVPFPYGEGTAVFDPPNHLLFVATAQGPEISVFADAENMNSTSTPAAIITLEINGVTTDRVQELHYDVSTDILFAEDVNNGVAAFDGFGATAESAVIDHTNPTIAANRYIQGFFTPSGLAYVPPPADELFVSEMPQGLGQVVVVQNASTYNGPVSHSQVITGFNRPLGLGFDNASHKPTDLLFVYDAATIYVIENGLTASGSLSSLLHTGEARAFYDANTPDVGFGMAIDTTP